jgi:hypothetical protein
MSGALRAADILLNLPRPIHWSSLEHQRTESANAVSFADWGEQGRCASDARWRRNAPARKELRNGSNKSEREPTSGRSTNYGSGHLIRVFRDIGRIFSLLFLLSHPSPIGGPAEREVQKRKRNMVSSKAKNGFNCVSCGTHRGGRAGGVSFAITAAVAGNASAHMRLS